jgi:hypothetical protein
MKRLFLTCGILLLALGATAQGAGKANTKVVFGGVNHNPESTQYFGNIDSPKKACANKRKVTVYRKNPAGRDPKVGSTKSEPGKAGTHFWDVTLTDPPLAGTYYAKTEETDDCRGDRSKDYLDAR